MFKNMKLGIKLGIGFGGVLLLTVIVTFMGSQGMEAIRDRVEKAENTNHILTGLFNAIIQEKHFAINGEESHSEGIHKEIGRLYGQISATKERFADKTNKDQMAMVMANLRSYEDAFSGYEEIAKKKNAAMAQMRRNAREALTLTQAIGEEQKASLEEIKTHLWERVREQIGQTDNVSRLLRHILEAKTYRTLIMAGDIEHLDGWKAINQKVYALLKRFKSVSRKEEERRKVDDILKLYKEYEENALRYLETGDSMCEARMIEAGDTALKKIKSIRVSQKDRLKEAQTDFEKEMGEKLMRTAKVNQLISLFLSSRKNEKEFIISNDTKYLDAANADFSKAFHIAETLGADADADVGQGRALLRSLGTYGESFGSLISLTRKQWEADRHMARIAQKAQNICKQAYADQKGKMYKEIAESRQIIFASAAIAVFAGILASFLITRNVSGTIGILLSHMERIAAGDLSRDIPEKLVRLSEETGQVAAALQRLIVAQRKKAGLAETIASGDLSPDAEIASDKDALGKALGKMISGLRSLIGQMGEASSQVDSGSVQVSDSSQSLSMGTTEQAASLEQISSSMNEIESQTRMNAKNALEANHLAEASKDAADRGRKEMGSMMSAMEEINKSGREVAKIVKIIDEIAFQINLLALNAAVEAARAGRHGKGFAVVAGEVRNLAGRSAKAATETSDMIEDVVKKLEKGNEIAGQTAGALNHIAESATKVAVLVSEIAASSEEQARGITQVNEGLGQVDQVTQQNAANAQETASAAEELAAQASQLRHMISHFRLDASSGHEKTGEPEFSIRGFEEGRTDTGKTKEEPPKKSRNGEEDFVTEAEGGDDPEEIEFGRYC